jgi:hypothetical protein
MRPRCAAFKTQLSLWPPVEADATARQVPDCSRRRLNDALVDFVLGQGNYQRCESQRYERFR